MSDLVKRIRDYPGERIAGSYELREQAAARIEALEAALSTAQQVIYDLTEGITGTIQCDRIEALEKALRLAIEELGWGELDQARRRLRAALAKEQDK